MRRREFLGVLGGAAGWPLVARAQQATVPVIGYLGAETPERFGIRISAFQQGLSTVGYDEGRNVTIEYRWADGQGDRLPALAVELVRRHVNVIVGIPTNAALAAKAATTTIPIIFETGLDPVQAGLVKSLNRPEGNITGVTSLNVDVGPKRLELLNQLLPSRKNFAVLVNPTNRLATETTLKDLITASRTLGLTLHVLNVSAEQDFETAFQNLAQMKVGGLIIGGDIYFHSRARQLAALSLKHSMPAILAVREFAATGGLISYGGDIKESHRQAGIYTGRILKGERLADLPVQQVTKLQLVINLKTAQAFRIGIPLPILGRADEVIE